MRSKPCRKPLARACTRINPLPRLISLKFAQYPCWDAQQNLRDSWLGLCQHSTKRDGGGREVWAVAAVLEWSKGLGWFQRWLQG